MNLFGLESIDELERSDVARRNLKNLLASYADEADIFTELIQNAFDSILQAHEEGLLNDEPGEVTIIIGRRSTGPHYIYVADNGIGMPHEVAKNITVPGYSHGKRRGRTIGYKGVGASYFFAASRKAAIKTIDINNATTEFTVRGAFEWVNDTEEATPTTREECDVPNFVRGFLPAERGTGVFFQFHDGMRPKNLNNIVIIGDGSESELKNWLAFLASKTALGTVAPNEELKIQINAKLDLGDEQVEQAWQVGEYNRDTNFIGYPFPHHVLRTAKNTGDIDRTPDHQRIQHTRRHPAVHKRWTADEIIEESSNLSEEEIQKLRQYLDWVDAYFCYSTDVLKEINSRLGGRRNLVRYGIKIACDGIPQGRNVDLSLTSSQGLDRQAHIVMSFNGLELDTGRKISADEIVASAIAKLGQRVVGVLKDYRWAMKKKDRTAVTSDLDTWVNNIDARSQTSLVRSLYNAKELAPVFTVDPDNESEVIALFVSLLSHQLLKGIRIKAISGFARYDSIVTIEANSTDLTDQNDVLSIRTNDAAIEGENRVLEFKHNFDDLLNDFEAKTKNPAEINVCVCWSVPTINVSRGRIDACYGKWRDHRNLYGSSHVWSDENDTSVIPILALKNLVCELLAKHETDSGIPGLGQATLATIEQSDEQSMI